MFTYYMENSDIQLSYTEQVLNINRETFLKIYLNVAFVYFTIIQVE